MDRAEPEGGRAELENDGRVSFEVAHVGMTCRSTAHDIDGKRAVVAGVWVGSDADERAVIDVIIVCALEFSGAVFKGEGHGRVPHDVDDGRVVV